MQIRAFLASIAVLAVTPAFAQTDDGEPDPPEKKVRIIYPDVETHDFDVRVIIGDELVRPAGISITGHPDAAFPSMIDERVHFKRDLAKSIGVGIKKSAKATETAPK